MSKPGRQEARDNRAREAEGTEKRDEWAQPDRRCVGAAHRQTCCATSIERALQSKKAVGSTSRYPQTTHGHEICTRRDVRSERTFADGNRHVLRRPFSLDQCRIELDRSVRGNDLVPNVTKLAGFIPGGRRMVGIAQHECPVSQVMTRAGEEVSIGVPYLPNAQT